MLKIAGKVPSSAAKASATIQNAGLVQSRTLAQQAPSQLPPLSQKYDASAPKPSPENQGSGKGGSFFKVFGGITVIGAAAAAGYILDPLGLFTEKKPLAPSPLSGNLAASLNRNTNSSEDTESSPSIGGQNKEESDITQSASDKGSQVIVNEMPTLTPAEARTSVLTSIAENSVDFLLTGTRSAEDEAVLAKLEEETLKERNRLEMVQTEKALARQRKRDAELLQETDKQKRNKDLELLLSREFSDVLEKVQTSTVLNHRAADVCTEYATELRKAMDAEIEYVAQDHWSRVCDLRRASLEQTSAARSATEQTRKHLADILDIIGKAKGDRTTSGHPSLRSFEKQASDISAEHERSVAKLNCSDSITDVMKSYYQDLEQQESSFQKEMEGKFPKFESDQKRGKLSAEQLKALLEHTHQKVLLLRRQLREQELFESQRLQEALREQRDRDDTEYKKRLEQELNMQEARCQKEQEVQLKTEAEKSEKKMEEELTKTCLALSKHGADMLKVQEKQLKEEHMNTADQQIEEERAGNLKSLVTSLSKIDQLTEHIAGKGDIDVLLNDLRQLTSSVLNLKHTINVNDPPTTAEYHTIKVREAIDRCKQASPDNAFVQTVLNSVPEKALSSGLYSLSSLERRFAKVYVECKKNVFLPDSAKIFSAGLARAYSSMTYFGVKPRYTTTSEFYSDGTEGMDSKDLLIQARYFIERHHLVEAVRCMVQLKGVPRTLAQDWIDEARLYLEVHQASEALYSYAMAQSLGQIF